MPASVRRAKARWNQYEVVRRAFPYIATLSPFELCLHSPHHEAMTTSAKYGKEMTDIQKRKEAKESM